MIETFLAMHRAILGLGLEPKDLTFVQIAARTVIVFFATLLILRFADKRFLPKKTVLDALVGFIVASLLARAINGDAPFWPSIGSGFIIILLHKAVASLAFRYKRIESFLKGDEHLLVHDGKLNEDLMRKHRITEKDLLGDLRIYGNVTTLDAVKFAYLEKGARLASCGRKLGIEKGEWQEIAKRLVSEKSRGGNRDHSCGLRPRPYASADQQLRCFEATSSIPLCDFF